MSETIRDDFKVQRGGGSPPTRLAAIWLIVRHDLAQNLRQRETLLWVFVMPVVFFYFFGTVTGGFGGRNKATPDPITLLAPADGGFLVDEIEQRLVQQGYSVERVSEPDAERKPDLELVIAAPAGEHTFTDAVLAGRQVKVTLRREADSLTGDYHKVRVARAVYGVVADLAVVVQSGEAATKSSFADLRAMPRPLTLEVTSAGRRRKVPSGFEQTIPGTMIMFTMLVLLTSGAIALVIERDRGLLRRLASAPITRRSIIGAKWVARMALALVQISFAMVVGTVLFKMTWGDSLPTVCLVLFLWASFNASLGLLLGSLARSERQMAGLGVMATMGMAALGGCWWPIEITPPWMQKLAMVLPTGWAMDAMHRLVSFGDGPTAVVKHVVLLAAATLVVARFAAARFRYE